MERADRITLLDGKEITIPSILGEHGITSSSANHISNVAKERYKSLELKLALLDFCKKTVAPLGSTDEVVMTVGTTEEAFSKIEAQIEEIGKCKGLIACLREGIKAKEHLTELVADAEDKELEDFDKEEPERGKPMDEFAALAKWSVKDRAKFHTLETMAAAIGQYIHPDGKLAKARERLMQNQNSPKELNTDTKGSWVVSYYPNIEEEKVDAVYFRLQAEHRSIQAEFNGLKARLEKEIAEDRREKSLKWEKEYQKWCEKRSLMIEEHNRKTKETLDFVSRLKIVVPNDLKELFDRMSK